MKKRYRWQSIISCVLMGACFLVLPYGHGSLIDEDFEGADSLAARGWTVAGTTVAISQDHQSIIENAPGDSQGLRLTDDNATAGQPNILQGISLANNVSLYVQFDFRYSPNVINAGFQLRDGASTIGVNLHM